MFEAHYDVVPWGLVIDGRDDVREFLEGYFTMMPAIVTEATRFYHCRRRARSSRPTRSAPTRARSRASRPTAGRSRSTASASSPSTATSCSARRSSPTCWGSSARSSPSRRRSEHRVRTRTKPRSRCMTFRATADRLLPPLTREEEIVLLARTLWREGFDDHLAGHITYRLDDGTLLTNPWFLLWNEFGPEDVIRIDLDGNVLEGDWPPAPGVEAAPRAAPSPTRRPCRGAQPSVLVHGVREPASDPGLLRPELGAGRRQGRRRRRVHRRRRRHRQRGDRGRGDG